MVVAVALLVLVVSRRLFKRQRLNLPPGPRALPIIGCLHLLGAHPHRDFADLARQYGPVMSLPLGQRYCVVATSPEAAKEFLKRQDANFSSRPLLRSAQIIFAKDLAFHDLTPVNRHLRSILVSELTSAKRVEASKYIRTEEAASMLGAIAKEMGRPIEVRTLVDIMFTNILSRMLFNKRFLGSEDQSATTSEVYEFMAVIEEAAACLGTIHLQDNFDFIPSWFDPQGLDARFRKLRARVEVFHRNVIEQHKEDRRKRPVTEGQKTLLDVVLDQLEHPESGVTEEHVLGVLWDVLAAGTNTSTLTSDWAMAEVLRNPDVGKNARLELDKVVGLKRVVEESDIPQLKYIQAIIKETLRLHPTVPLLIPHQNISATKAFGYDIPAKTRLFVNIWAIGRDPSIWEKPLDFIPERFLEGGPHEMVEAQGKNFELLPFGAGRRQCPGMVFGLVSVHLQVASLLHAFDWSLPSGMTPDMLDMTDGLGLTPPMSIPLVAVAKPRLPSHLYQ